MISRKGSKGFTLLECMIYCALFAMLAVGTMRVIGEARMVRSNARDRTQLALLAQGELDRIRSAPVAERKVGVQTLTKPGWPSGTQLQVELQTTTGGMLSVEVRATRSSIEGKPTVRLASLVPGGTP